MCALLVLPLCCCQLSWSWACQCSCDLCECKGDDYSSRQAGNNNDHCCFQREHERVSDVRRERKLRGALTLLPSRKPVHAITQAIGITHRTFSYYLLFNMNFLRCPTGWLSASTPCESVCVKNVWKDKQGINIILCKFFFNDLLLCLHCHTRTHAHTCLHMFVIFFPSSPARALHSCYFFWLFVLTSFPTCAVHECKSPFSCSLSLTLILLLVLFYFLFLPCLCVCFVFPCSLRGCTKYPCIPLSLLRSICIRPCNRVCVLVCLCVCVSRAGSACKNSKIAPTRCAMVEHLTSL